MNFYAFEYEKEIDFESIKFEDSEYVQTIKDKKYYFLHKKLYDHNYPDDWSDEQTKETKTGVASPLEQLKEQIFILIDIEKKHIFSNIDSAQQTNRIIEEILKIQFKIFQRLVNIEEFESKISKLISITIKSHSLKQTSLFGKEILNPSNQIVDLSEIENFKLSIGYNLSIKKNKVVTMYKKMVDEFNVREVIFNGSNNGEHLFQFNQQSIIHKIPIKLSKNGEGNTFDYKEVYALLTNQL